MGFWSTIGDLFRSRARLASVHLSGEPAATYSINAALDCSTVTACLNLVSAAVATLEFETPDARLRQVLQNPNDWQSHIDFKTGLVWSILSYGNAYMIRPAGSMATPVGLLDPGDVRVVSGPLRRPQYHIGGETYGPDRVVHFRDTGGSGLTAPSRLKPLWPRIAALLQADRRINTNFRRGVNASAVVEIPGDLAADSAVQERIRQEIQNHHSAVDGTGDSEGGVLMLHGGTLKQLSPGGSASDTDLRALRQDLIREIAAAFGVPPFSVGGAGDTKYSNVVARHAQRNQDAILPVADAIAARFAVAYNTTVTYEPEILLRGDFLHTAEVATKAAGGAVMTPAISADRYFGLTLTAEGADKLRSGGSSQSADGDRRDERPDDGSESEAAAA